MRNPAASAAVGMCAATLWAALLLLFGIRPPRSLDEAWERSSSLLTCSVALLFFAGPILYFLGLPLAIFLDGRAERGSRSLVLLLGFAGGALLALAYAAFFSWLSEGTFDAPAAVALASVGALFGGATAWHLTAKRNRS